MEGGKDYFFVKCMEDWYERKGSCGEGGMRKPVKFMVLHFKCWIYAKVILKVI